MSATLLVAACGGGGGGSDSSSAGTPGGGTPPATRSGIFLDSPVAGLAYTSGSIAGTTGADGSFTCEVGQPVVFSVGNARLPQVTCTSTTEVVTPVSVFATTDATDTRVVNLARLLQTLDSDGNPDNGISLASQVHTSAASLPASIDFSSTAAFESAVNGLVATLAGAAVIPSATLVAPTDATTHLQAQLTSIAGAWAAIIGEKRILFTFFPNGVYVHSESGPADAAGHGGMERGTYTWNASTGAFASTCPSVDTNGEWGLSHGTPGICTGTTATVTVAGNTLRFQASDGETVELTRVADALNPIIGSWSLVEGNTRILVTFLRSGQYFHAESGTVDPNGQNGFERGAYTWNSTTGAFSTTCPVVDTNGEWGFSHDTPGVCSGSTGTATVSGNTLTIALGSGDSVQLSRVRP